jgi:RNA polymerase sigma-70 factor (ECF subfamily)
MQPPPATPEALLEHLDWVRQLARSLVADQNAADDLVQEAWMSAARRPPREGNLRGWLAQVVRNAARDRRRKETRRARHDERAARHESTPSGAEIADRVAVQQELVQCVLQLEEPYRETVLLRYFQELDPTDIAQRTGVPLATVKTRLRRALAELRERLDRANGGDRRAWMAALLPLAQTPASFSTAGTGALWIMSTKSIALVAAVLAVTGLGILLWVRGAERPEDTLVAGSGDAAPTLETLATPPDAPAPAALTVDEPRATRVATPAEGQRVTVVDRGTGAPVPGAQVWHRAMTDSTSWNDLAVDREEHVRSAGSRLVADERGEALVPCTKSCTAVVARSGTAYGELVLHGESADPARIEIGPDSTVVVRVVDFAEQPVANAHVGVRKLAPGRGDGYGHIVARATTSAPDGLARMAHLSEREPELRSAGSWAVAAVDGAFVPPVLARFDPRDPPAGPLQLVMPPAGRVVVILKSAGDRPLPDGWVHLEASVPQAREGGRFVRGIRVDRYSRQGRAEFEHVGLDLDIEVRSRPSNEWAERSVRRAGPRAPGEEVVVTIEFGAAEPIGEVRRSFPVIVGRLLDATGTLRPGEALSGRIVLSRPDGTDVELSLHASTDREGRFRIPIESGAATDALCRLHVRTGDTAEGGVWTADVDVSEPLRGGDHPIGDVVLGEPAVCLSGTVRDTSGAPIHRALVDVARRRPATPSDDPPGYDWIPGQRAMTDEQGRYVVSGVLPPGEYLVDVRCDRHVSTGLEPFTPGTRGHDVVLRRWGALEGRLRLPDGVGADRIVVEAGLQPGAPRRADGTGWTRGSAHVLPDGTFQIDEIPPGPIDVRVRLDGDDEPLASIEGVQVPEGGPTTDPRLHPVELRGGVLHQIRIRIRGPDPSRAPAAAVALRPAGDARAAPRRILCEDGELVFVSRWPAVDVEVRAAELRTARREGVTGEATIEMEPGIALTVRLPADIELPTAPDDLSLLLIPSALHEISRAERLHEEDRLRDHELYYWLSSQGQRFDARRELTFRLPEAGPYFVGFAVERRDSSGSRYSSIDLRDDGLADEELFVRESDDGQSIELDVGPGEVAAARARMR